MNLAMIVATTATKKFAMILMLSLCFCLNNVCHANLIRGRVSTTKNEKDPKSSQSEEYYLQGYGLCTSSKGEQYNIVSYVIDDKVEIDANPVNPTTLCSQEKYCGNTEFVIRGFQYINEGSNAKFCECLFEKKHFPSYDMLQSSSEKFNTLFGVTTDLTGEGSIVSVTKPMLSMVVAECYSKNNYDGIIIKGTMAPLFTNGEEKTGNEAKNHENSKKDEKETEEEEQILSLDEYLEQTVTKKREEKLVREKSTLLVGGVVHSSESIEQILERIHHETDTETSKNYDTLKEDKIKTEKKEQVLSLDEYLEQAIQKKEKKIENHDSLKKDKRNIDTEEERVLSLDEYLEQTVKRQEEELTIKKSPLVGGVMHSSEPLEKIIEMIQHGSKSKISRKNYSSKKDESGADDVDDEEQILSMDKYLGQTVKRQEKKLSGEKSAPLVGGVMHSSEPLEKILEMIHHGSEAKISKKHDSFNNDERSKEKLLSLDGYLEQTVVKKQEKQVNREKSAHSLGGIMRSSELSDKMTKRAHRKSNPKLSYLYAMEYMYI